MLNILDYRLNEERKYKRSNIIVLIMLVFIIIGVIIVSKKVYYYNYYQNTCIIENTNNLVCLVDIDNLSIVTSNKILKINNKNFAYNVNFISEDTINNIQMYKQVFLQVELEDNQNIKNNIIDIKILSSKMTIFKYILKTIKGE